MITISLCMIVKNEEEVLARCLDSVKDIVDEIIIVDTGSTDKTISIAKEFTEHVYLFQWQDDFSLARNFSFSKATKDYILWLDADDVIDSENKIRFLNIKETLPQDVDGVVLPYNTAFDKAGKPIFTYFRERIVRRTDKAIWNEPVHEHLSMFGKIVTLDAAVSHMPEKRHETHPDRNLRIYQKRVENGEKLSTRGKFYFARELKTHKLLDEAIKQYDEVLKGKKLWLEDAITASYDLADCYVEKGMNDKALEVLFASFEYDLPRAEILCRIGAQYVVRKDYPKAIFWYSLALEVPTPTGWGFSSKAYRDYIPNMQLCMLYSRIGNNEKAFFHHQIVKKLHPDNEKVLYNEKYFQNIGFKK